MHICHIYQLLTFESNLQAAGLLYIQFWVSNIVILGTQNKKTIY